VITLINKNKSIKWEGIRVKKVRFRWKDGRVTFLWPDHPLVIAGNMPLDIVLQQFENNIDEQDISRNIASQFQLDIGDTRTYAHHIIKTIETINDNSVNSVLRNDHHSLSMATLNLTRKCNLECEHCYNRSKGSVESRYEEMSLQQIGKAVAILGKTIEHEPKLLIISGGEPTLEIKKVETAISTAREYGLKPRLNTNGYFITDKLSKILSSNNVLVQVSLDGKDAETNALLRKKIDAFDVAISAIKRLVNNGCRVRISCTTHSLNVNQIPEMIDLAQSLGAEQFITSNLVVIGNALRNNLQPVEFNQEFTILYNAVKSSVEKQRMTRSTLFGETINAIRAGIKFTYCGTGCCTCCVDADGSIYPCINMIRNDYCVGNIIDSNFESIWRHSPILNNLRNLDVDTINVVCRKCIFRYFCGAYCRGETLEVGQVINSPYIRCKSWKRGLIKIFDFLSETPDIYNLNSDPYLGVLHRE